MKKTVQVLIRGYQWLISPMLGNRCRFHPTCSAFAMEAIEKRGLVSGSWETLKRLMRCHPFHAGGYDPVIDLKHKVNDHTDQKSIAGLSVVQKVIGSKHKANDHTDQKSIAGLHVVQKVIGSKHKANDHTDQKSIAGLHVVQAVIGSKHKVNDHAHRENTAGLNIVQAGLMKPIQPLNRNF